MRKFRALLHRDDSVVAAYVALVVAIAAALLAVTWATIGVRPLDDHLLELAVLLAIVGWCEAKPITVIRAGGVDHVVASTTFAFAIFLTVGMVPAMIAQGLASLVADTYGRKPPIKVAFNVGQYVVAWAAAGGAYTLAGTALGLDPLGTADDLFAAPWFAAVLAAGLTYFAVNNVLVGTVLSLSTGGRIVPAIRSSLTAEWSTDLLLLALGPVVVLVVDRSILVLPLMLLPILAVYRSVTLSAEKQHLALHDPLTDLPNRFNFTSVLEARVRHATPDRLAAVMLFDLDHFKEVNDTLGHQAGDDLLRMIGPRIQAVLPAGSTVGRFGGDEFAVLVPTLDQDRDAFDVAHAIVAALEAPFRLEGFNIEVKGSIGIAIHPADGADGEELIKRADIAMYVAKGGGTVVERYDPELDHHSTRRLEMVGELRNAISTDEVVLYFQPKLDLLDGCVTEVEALVRWDHPRLGVIDPSEFVPLAEHTGLIRPLTSHLLGVAARQIATWRSEGARLIVAVNLSVRSLHDERLVDEVADALAAAGIPPRLLRLEITEGSIMADPDRSRRVLERLAAMGVRVSIDDFGTGYSSLAYLKDLPVDEIKIDRSFVTNLLTSAGDQVIVRAIIDLAANLGLTSVAEGVEDLDQLRWLTDAGCVQAQGYHIARPMSAAAFSEWLGATSSPA
ncbi:MAG: bifunctional diguanylate cyclase/phosphodiesterase [Ilumatobacteraceae bacterium]